MAPIIDPSTLSEEQREKVKNLCRTWSNGMKLQPQSQAHRSVVATMRAIFGDSIFR